MRSSMVHAGKTTILQNTALAESASQPLRLKTLGTTLHHPFPSLLTYESSLLKRSRNIPPIIA
ncbi:hypothetical protein ACRQ1B_08915 [Rhizobium panacihumi]|uniref:hypothetical protein n=1 Tax=Rhizobium panacihumi TaxID=2008450 RepID=UPI003D7A2A1B